MARSDEMTAELKRVRVCLRCKASTQTTLMTADSTGTWKCSACGAILDADGFGNWAWAMAWRWNGQVWEHKCPGGGPQGGHFQAERLQTP